MAVVGLDHAAVPTADAERLVAFYVSLGFETSNLQEWRDGTQRTFSILCGNSKINVHPETMFAHRGEAWYLRGANAEPGCADLCFVWEGGIDQFLARTAQAGLSTLLGPLTRVGGREDGRKQGVSVYLSDPDANLIEFISYDDADLLRYS